MGPKVFSALASISLLANAVLLTAYLSSRGPSPAFGQTADGSGRFIIGTERGADQSPMCFVISQQIPEKPQLLVYRVDPAGQLQLSNAREITCDLKLRDNFFPAQTINKVAGKTAPPVKMVCDALGQGGITPPAGPPNTGAGGNGKATGSGKEKTKPKAEKGTTEKGSNQEDSPPEEEEEK